jgi:hypothetical protein
MFSGRAFGCGAALCNGGTAHRLKPMLLNLRFFACRDELWGRQSCSQDWLPHLAAKPHCVTISREDEPKEAAQNGDRSEDNRTVRNYVNPAVAGHGVRRGRDHDADHEHQ